MASPNRFCFIAIVRDEEPVIERCLSSIKDIATSYFICDTGSVDNTAMMIEKFMESIPGLVEKVEWVDYGHNKTQLLRRAREFPLTRDAKYFVWLDADEVFITDPNNPKSYPTKAEADKLFDILEASKENVFMFKTVYLGVEYPRWQIVRNDRVYVWRLPFQEYLTADKYETKYIEMLINLSRKEGNSSRDPDINKKRIAMMERWLEENSSDADLPRAIFYLARAYSDVDKNKARELYLKRLALGGFFQEKYWSLLDLGGLAETIPEKVNFYDVGAKAMSERLEAYYYEMITYMANGDMHRASMVAYSAPENREPDPSFLFVQRSIYDYLFDLKAAECYFARGRLEHARDAISGIITRNKYPQEEKQAMHSRLININHRFAILVPRALPSSELSIKVGVNSDAVERSPPRIGDVSPSIIVIDNFYEDPYRVRAEALAMDFPIKGNYPGARTVSVKTDAMKARFESIVGRKINYWPDGYNGSFQYTLGEHKSWIHRDQTDYSVVVYLTPEAPLDGGTLLYKHRETGVRRLEYNENETLVPNTRMGFEVLLNSDGNDENKWEVVDRIGNVFNRAIIFQGRLNHKSDRYFGSTKEDGRLFQTFFFNVEGRKI